MSCCLLLARTSSWRFTVLVGSCLVTLAHLFAALTPASWPLGNLLALILPEVMYGLEPGQPVPNETVQRNVGELGQVVAFAAVFAGSSKR